MSFDLDEDQWTKRVVKQEDYSEDQEAEAAAAKRGLVVVLPQERELFVDIDNDAQWQTFLKVIEKLTNTELAASWDATPSASGLPHRHVRVQLTRSVKPIERIALQALLGSDPIREWCSYERLAAGHVSPTRFFERKSEAR